MKSVSVSRFAALATSLFLSSNDGGQASIIFVESFSVAPRTSRTNANAIGGKTHRLANPNPNRNQFDSSYPSRSRLQSANLDVESTPLGYNETSSTALLDASMLPADPASLAEAERAWALESPTIDDSNGEQRSLTDKFLTPEVLGPIVSIVLVVLFLGNTLLSSCGLSDTFDTMDLSHKMDVLGTISWLPGSLFEAKVVVGFVMAFSAFAQALTGFGFAVVAVGAMSSMPWLLHSELYDVITPVAATLGALVGFILLIPYAFAEGPATEEEPGLDWGEILPLLIPCTILTPVGIQLNSMVDPVLGTRILAGLIMGFVAYKLVPIVQEALGSDSDDNDERGVVIDVTGGSPVVTTDAALLALSADDTEEEPFLQSRTAAILFGSAAGIFGGAFDVQGPPLCVYGDAKGWSPAKFRNIILAVVCLNSALVVAIDYFEGALGDFYYSYFCLTSLPGVLLGVVAGQWASERIDPVLFKNLVLVMCLGLGIQLLRVS